MNVYNAKSLRELKKENVRLKKRVAELNLNNVILRDVNSKLISPAKRKAAVEYVIDEHGVTQRWAYNLLHVGRTVSRDEAMKSPNEDELR